MSTLVTFYWILKVLATAISLFLGGRKIYRWIRKKIGTRKPTAKG